MIDINEPNYSCIENNTYNNSSITHFNNNNTIVNEYRYNNRSYRYTPINPYNSKSITHTNINNNNNNNKNSNNKNSNNKNSNNKNSNKYSNKSSCIENNTYNNSSITHFNNNNTIVNEYRYNNRSYRYTPINPYNSKSITHTNINNNNNNNKNSNNKNSNNKNSNNKNSNKYSNKSSYTSRYFVGKLTRDGLYSIYDYRKKPEFNEQYVNNLVKDYVSGYALRKGLDVIAKITSKQIKNRVLLPFNFSQHMLAEVDYLKSNNMYNASNLKVARFKSLINTGYKIISPDISLGNNVIGNATLSLIDMKLDKLYTPTPEYNSLGNFYNNTSLFIFEYCEMPVYELINNADVLIMNGISVPIRLSQNIIAGAKYLVDYGENLINESIKFMTNTTHNNSTIIIDNTHNTIVSNNTHNMNSDFMCRDSASWLYDEYEYYNYNTSMSLAFDSENNKLNTTLENKGENNIGKVKEKEKNNFDIKKITMKLSNLSQFINLCNMLKDLDLTDINTIVDLQYLLVNLIIPDKLVNGVFRFIIDNTMHTKDKLETMLNLMVAVSEKYLEIPLTNAFNFVKNVFERKSVKEYLKPLLMDLTSLIVPCFNIVTIVFNIKKGIEYLLSRQSIKRLNGIDFLYTDEVKLKLFKIKHIVSYKNDFFGINITNTSRHVRNAKNACHDEFIKQLEYKVYQVIGIPIEFINGSIETPKTRYGLYAQKFYIEDLEKYWLEVNDPYLSEEDKKIINALYFESQTNKDYRYELAQRGEKPSWYWEHKNDTIGEFIYNLVDFISGKNYKISDIKKIINSIFNNTNITKNESLKDQENKNQNDIFTKAKNKRNSRDNRNLDKNRDSLRQSYNALIKQYSRAEIMRRARLELWHTQKTVDYMAQCGYSSFIGHFGTMLSYIDYEIVKLEKPVDFILGHIGGYLTNFGQGYLTRVLVDQSCLYVSLLRQTEHLTDEYLLNYINPAIACLVGLGLGIIKYTLPSNKEEPQPFKNVLINGGVSAVNTSFGMIYNYIKPRVFIKYLTNIGNKCVNGITNVIKYVFRLSLTVDFVGAVSLNILFNVGMRLLSKLYGSINYIEDNPIYNDLNNPIYNDLDNPIYNDLNNPIYNDLNNPIYNDLNNSGIKPIRRNKKKNSFYNKSHETNYYKSHEKNYNISYEYSYN